MHLDEIVEQLSDKQFRYLIHRYMLNKQAHTPNYDAFDLAIIAAIKVLGLESCNEK